MRRNTEGVLVGGEIHEEEPALAPAEVISILEPLVTDARRLRLQEVFSNRLSAVTLVVDGLHDPHNGAALVRTCDAFGVATMHAIEHCEPIAVSRNVSRGSQKWVKVIRHTSPAQAIAELQRDGFELVATHPNGELLPEDLPNIPRVALVLGNERNGITDAVRAACLRSVRVPMVGFVESLNVSVTAAILLYAATRGRVGDLSTTDRQKLYARGLFLTVPHARDLVGVRDIVSK